MPSVSCRTSSTSLKLVATLPSMFTYNCGSRSETSSAAYAARNAGIAKYFTPDDQGLSRMRRDTFAWFATA